MKLQERRGFHLSITVFFSCPPPGPPNRFAGGPMTGPSGPPMPGFHQHPSFGRPQMMPPPTGAPPLSSSSTAPVPQFSQPPTQRMPPMNAQPTVMDGGSGGSGGGGGQLDVSDLLSKLVEQGLISNSSASASEANNNGNSNKKDKGMTLRPWFTTIS